MSKSYMEKDYEKIIGEFAKDTLKEVEVKSQMFGITVNQIANVTNIRK